jgi:hypothetical protein
MGPIECKTILLNLNQRGFMIVKEKTKDKITISFSGRVGKEGLARIKDYIEFLEKSGIPRRKKVPQSVINKLADEINEAAWKKFKKAKGIK